MTFILLFSVQSMAYIVKKGDTLASIVKKFYDGPVYGKDGGIEALIRNNKGIIKNPNYVPPGTVIKLNDDLLKEGIVDREGFPPEEVVDNSDAESDSAQGLNPYIEVEKAGEQKTEILKYSNSDKINFFAGFQFNNLEARDRTSLATLNFSTSSETNIGFQYVGFVSADLSLFGTLVLNQYSVVDVTSFSPNLQESERSQAAGSIGIHYLFTDDNYLDVALNFQPHYSLIVDSSNGALHLRHEASPSISISTENYFLKLKDSQAGLDLGFELITNTQDPGPGSAMSSAYHAGIVYQQEFKTTDRITIKLNYKSATNDSVNYALTNQAFELNFIYSLPF